MRLHQLKIYQALCFTYFDQDRWIYVDKYRGCLARYVPIAIFKHVKYLAPIDNNPSILIKICEPQCLKYLCQSIYLYISIAFKMEFDSFIRTPIISVI